jgi:hypothetical protein
MRHIYDISTIHLVTQEWLQDWVLGYGLCPFAHKPHREKLIRIKVLEFKDEVTLSDAILLECKRLLVTTPSELETTLVVVNHWVEDFMAYWDFTAYIESLMVRNNYEGIIQLATFHPKYIFAGEAETDPSVFTNRSPFPVFHLLREDSLSKAIETYPKVELIPQRNIEYMRQFTFGDLLSKVENWQLRCIKK